MCMCIMDNANPIHFRKVPDMITYSYVLTYRPIGSGETLLSYNILHCYMTDWRESCLLIGLICLHKSLCLPENWSLLAKKVI